MTPDRLIPPALDPTRLPGLRHWLLAIVLVSISIAFASQLPIYSLSDNPAFRAWQTHIKQQPDLPSPTLWPAVTQQATTFDTQMILESRRCWDDEGQPDSAGPKLRIAKSIASYTTHLAKGEAVLAILLLLWIYSWRRNLQQQIQKKLLAGFLGLISASAISLGLKFLIGRGRPNELLWRARLHWDSFALDHNHHSFPSGHATASGAMTMIMILLFPRGWPIWLGCGLWLSATRVLATEHWPTDTLLGFTMGAFCVALISAILERRQSNQDPASNHSSKTTVLPVE
ncbi:MAG: phosphatase PAP2 family protein [Planctomycetota bacterium]